MLQLENVPAPAPNAPAAPERLPTSPQTGLETSQWTNSTPPVVPPDNPSMAMAPVELTSRNESDSTIDVAAIPPEIAGFINNLGSDSDFLKIAMKAVPPEHTKILGDIFAQSMARLESEDH